MCCVLNHADKSKPAELINLQRSSGLISKGVISFCYKSGTPLEEAFKHFFKICFPPCGNNSYDLTNVTHDIVVH